MGTSDTQEIPQVSGVLNGTTIIISMPKIPIIVCTVSEVSIWSNNGLSFQDMLNFHVRINIFLREAADVHKYG